MAVSGSRITVDVNDGKSPLAGVAVAVSPSVFLDPSMLGSPTASVTSDARGVVTCYALPGTYSFTPASGEAIPDQVVDDTLGGAQVPATTVTALTALVAAAAAKSANLSDLTDEAVARANLGVAMAVNLPENVKAHGAKGDGSTDDTAAIIAAMAVRGSIYFPPGNYIWNGDGTELAGHGNPCVLGEGRGLVTITVSAGKFFLDDSTAWTQLHIQGVTFTGGKGHLRNTYSGVNVNGSKIVTACRFLNHTGAAISSEASDEPYWHIEKNDFQAANTSTAMHVALGGNADDCTLRDNNFLTARIKVKFRNMYTARVDGCDFVPFGTQTGGDPRAEIWIVPQSGGVYGGVITASKFGNENIASGDFHILIADEGSGTYVGDKLPVLGTPSTGVVQGLTVDQSCDFQGASAAAPPFVYSMTNILEYCSIGGVVTGTAPAEIVQFYSPSTGSSNDRLGESTVIGPVRGNTEGAATPLMSNANGAFGRADDPAMYLAQDPMTAMPGTGDTGGVTSLIGGPISGWSTVSASVSAGTDTLGGSNETEVTFSAGGILYKYPTSSPTTGKLLWIEFGAKVGTSSSLTTLDVWLAEDSYGSGGAIYFKRTVTLQPTMTQYRFCVSVPKSSAHTFLFFHSASAGHACIERPAMYHARAPINRDALPFASGARLFMVTGVPASGLGGNGDFAFRTDGTTAGHTVIYHKESGSWVATSA